MLDTKILETRLLTRDSVVGTGGSLVSKCASRLQALVKSKKESPASQDSPVLDNFLRDVMLYRLEISKVEQIFSTCDKQIDSYKTLQREIIQKIDTAKASISNLEVDLDNERQIRRHREVLEDASKEVSALPTKNTLKRRIVSTHDGIKSVQDGLSLLDQRIHSRHLQFQSLIQCITDLQSKLVEDEDASGSGAVAIDGANEEEEGEGDERGDADDGDRRGRTAVRADNAKTATADEGQTEREMQDQQEEPDTVTIDEGAGVSTSGVFDPSAIQHLNAKPAESMDVVD